MAGRTQVKSTPIGRQSALFAFARWNRLGDSYLHGTVLRNETDIQHALRGYTTSF